MRTLRRFFKQLISWAKTQRDEERLRAEIEEHLALQTAENVQTGLSPVEARRQAVLKFGAVEAIREAYRDQRGIPFVETLSQDTRHALRHLRKAPAFTITTVLMLALGIGATTSIFTLVHAVLLNSLAVTNPDQLYRLGRESRCCYQSGYSQDKEFSIVSYDLYKYFRDNTKDFAELAAFQAFEPLFGIRRSGDREAAQSDPGEFVSGNYFTMFGIKTYAGRALTASDDQPNAPPVAVMSYRLWQRRVISIRTLSEQARRIRADCLWIISWVAVGVRRRTIPGHQLYGMNPYNPVVTLVAVVTLGLSVAILRLSALLRSLYRLPRSA